MPIPTRKLLLAAAASCAVLAAQGPASSQDGTVAGSADLIITNARVYTVDEKAPWAEAVAVDDGKIVSVGTTADVMRWRGSGTRMADIGGRLLMPAFGDAHVHPTFGGMAYSRCSLHAGKSLQDYQRIIAGCVEKSSGEGVIYGVGWEDAQFPPNGIPRKEILDEVSRDRPLIFESNGGHTYWVNSKTLELAGITAETPDPPNGHIDRDSTTGEPVGGLQEAAMALVAQMVPQPTDEEIQASIRYVAEFFNGLGIVTWHDAGIDLDAAGKSATLDAYEAVKDSGNLSAHVSLAFKWANDRSLEQVPTILSAVERAGAAGFQGRSVKFYLDGVIPQHTAAMLEPYEEAEGVRGELQIAPEILNEAVRQLGAKGIQPHVHAIGDRATRVALDAFEAAIEANGTANRPMISHLNVIDPADDQRFGQLGAIALFQPTWASNYPYMDLTKQAIGHERAHSIYPARSVLKGGGILAYGADWPVATANPFEGLQIAVTRTSIVDPASGPLLPEEAITLQEAIRAHTINVAYALGLDEVTGSIAVGKSADLIVLDRDILNIPLTQVSQAKVLVTLFAGEEVHGSLAVAEGKAGAD